VLCCSEGGNIITNPHDNQEDGSQPNPQDKERDEAWAEAWAQIVEAADNEFDRMMSEGFEPGDQARSGLTDVD